MSATVALEDAAPASETVVAPQSELRWLCDLYMSTQKHRIMLGNQIAAVERTADLGPIRLEVRRSFERLQASEEELRQAMEEALLRHPAKPWLDQVIGIGPTLGGKLLGLIGSIDRFDTVSKLWRFAGYAVIDGARERPTKGEKLHYNLRLKTALYLVAVSMLRGNSAYRIEYDRARLRYDAVHPDWTPGHKHAAALRKMIKLFLAHLWETWRVAEGLPVRAPFAVEALGHTSYIPPTQYLGRGPKRAKTEPIDP